MGSSNGTFVNGQRLFSEQPNILIEGDEIRLGNLVATITYTPTNAEAR
jgi:pSer/pThr/pTyr-binding forkhead associated (FHA) protein